MLSLANLFGAKLGTNPFAFNLFHRLREQPGNLFFSPYSVAMALGMAAQGARGTTADQMHAVLGCKTSQAPAMHAAFGKLRSRFNGDERNRGYRLSVANALWGQAGFFYQSQFLAESQAAYGAGLHPLDFAKQPDPSRLAINAWVEEQTQEKIKDLLPPGAINSDSRLVLTNAVYFKGDWLSPFKEGRTEDGLFATSTTRKVAASLMYQYGHFRYWQTPAMQLLELPYGLLARNPEFATLDVIHDLSMLILLPTKVDGLAALEASLTLASLDSEIERMKSEPVEATLPKFRLNTTALLGSTLANMGMPLAFDAFEADFTGMTKQERLWITGVIHKAFVNVNEAGTEAAAATAMIAVAGCAPGSWEPPPPPRVFRADHPFLFLIRDNETGTILFMGRFAEPDEGCGA